jgi:glutamate 5-kinase
MGRSGSRNSPCTVVIKLGTLSSSTSCPINSMDGAGTSSIVHEQTHQPLLSTLSSVVETVIRLKNQGHKVILVSSGAIGVGLKRMEMPSRPKNLSGKQVCNYPFRLVLYSFAVYPHFVGTGCDRTGAPYCAIR